MATELLSVWNTVGSVLLAILILLVMITVHEFGHYVVGKALKFKIDEFSIGFGPAFVKIRRKKSGELFAVRLLPLGGYCSFHGEDGTDEDGQEETAEKADGKAAEAAAPFGELENGETLLVTPPEELSGPAENAAENAAENPISEPSEGAAAPPEKPKKRDWNDDGTFTNMKPWKRIAVLVAGACMNYLLAFLLILLCFGIYGESFVELRGVEASEEYPAAYSLREGDILLEIDGRGLYLTMDVARAVNKHKAGDTVEVLVSRVQEDGSRKEERVTVMLRAEVELKNSADFTGVWKSLGAGVETHDDGNRYYMVQTANYSFGFFETVGRSFVYSFKIAGSIFRVIGELFTGKLGLSALGGPVTTVKTTATVVSHGFRSFLEIAGFIGVNLAVFNLLPIPALDGSKVVFTAIEWVRGRPISRKIEAIIHAVGFVVLIGFAILVDILQFV